jgi:superoxide dismutase, Fe-Mn family
MTTLTSRREALKRTGLLAASLAWGGALLPDNAPGAEPAPAGPFTLPPLPYAVDALEPYVDAQTMQIHHDKHHQAYVTNLNKAVAGHPELEAKTVEELLRDLPAVPESIRKAVQNQGGGHANHTFFWQLLKKSPGGRPTGELAKAIDRQWGSLDGFKAELTKAATTLFGSGWVWLVLNGRELSIQQSPNQDTPLSQGRTPLIGLDLWEHAYYLKYQNRRPEYVAAFYNVIHWDFVSERYARLA